jgi:hypothetical protein
MEYGNTEVMLINDLLPVDFVEPLLSHIPAQVNLTIPFFTISHLEGIG